MTQESQEGTRAGQEEVGQAGAGIAAGPTPRRFGRDFLTGCVALIIIGLVILIVIPVLVVVLKVSLLVAVPIGLVVVLLIFTTLFGRTINMLRKRW